MGGRRSTRSWSRLLNRPCDSEISLRTSMVFKIFSFSKELVIARQVDTTLLNKATIELVFLQRLQEAFH